MKFKTIFLAVLAFANVYSQSDKVWFFGANAGLDFNTAIPTILTGGQTNNFDCTSTICDANGALLFYSNGVSVWNKNHAIMPNGSGLAGNIQSGQAALIVPIPPCNSNKYAIFTTTEFASPGNLNYTVVDMTLNGGLGDVVVSQKNVSLGSGWTEKLHAYYNNSGDFYWVLTHKWGNSQFVAFKVDASSIATTSVVTSIGSTHTCGNYGSQHDAMGELTISPDGTKIVNPFCCSNIYEFFDFNSATGVLSNSISIPGDGGYPLGSAFSPDSKKVYFSSILGTSVFQYDISNYNSAAIIASKVAVYTAGSSGNNFGYMALGPDKKLYISQPNTSFMAVVQTPNGTGAACTFSYNGQSVSPKQSQWGVSRTSVNFPIGNFTLTASSNSIACNGSASGNASVSVNPNGSYNYTWSPGSYTTQNISNVSSGNYTVTVSSGCATSTAAVIISQPPAITLNVSPSTTLCSGGVASSNSITITSTVSGGTPAYSYSWSNGNTFSGIVVSPTITTSYSLTVTDNNGCNSSAVTTVSVITCTGIKEIGNSSFIILYPNPFTDKISVISTLHFDEVKVYNLLGSEIQNLKNTQVISLQDLPSGIYYIKLFEGNSLIACKKAIKE